MHTGTQRKDVSRTEGCRVRGAGERVSLPHGAAPCRGSMPPDCNIKAAEGNGGKENDSI